MIFLDFDGVICSPRAMTAQHDRWTDDQAWLNHTDQVACHLVNRLCREHGARLVVSSSWRLIEEPCRLVMGHYELDRLLHEEWRTGEADLKSSVHLDSRPWEINDWLARNGDPEFVILDDDDFAWDDRQMKRWVRTSVDDGLLLRHWHKASAMLRGIGQVARL